MTEHMSRGMDRRDFLRKLGVGTAAAIGAGYTLSVWEWSGPAGAAVVRAGDLGDPKGRTLVIVEMGGGNDGLNTVVPISDGRYHDLRPTLGITDAIDLDGEVGLHPKLAKLAKRYKQGDVAIVHGLGYDDPDLSHFGSFGIWWSAKGGSGGAGWLGTYLDGTVGFDDPLAAINIGPGRAPALLGRESFATSIADDTGLQPNLPSWIDAADTDSSVVDELMTAWSNFEPAHVDTSAIVGQVQRAIALTDEARDQLSKSLDDSARHASAPPDDATAQYRERSVTDSLDLAARLIKSPAKPRLIYVNSIGDFDTHQGEAQRHPALMEQLDAGIDSFFTSLGKAADDVVLITVSEFGRRPAENGSGTDHGTANVHFVVGPSVKGGRYGEQPSLANLDKNGNLVHTEDFRRLYATGLKWLRVDDSSLVLGEDFKSFPVFK